MKVIYIPNEKILIDDITIMFGETRQSIRDKLQAKYKVDDQIIDLNDPDEDLIYQRRDIYENIHGTVNFFFLSYTQNDHLNEIEVHYCEYVTISGIEFSFNDNLNDIVEQLATQSNMVKKDQGDYFFPSLKLSLWDKQRVGGEGETLGYVYFASDVSHLEEN